MLGKGFGDVGEAKGSSTTGSQFLEQFKTAQALAQLAAQHTQPGGSTTASSWDMGSTTQTSSLVQYGKEKQCGSPKGNHILPDLQKHAASSSVRIQWRARSQVHSQDNCAGEIKRTVDASL